MTAYRTRSRARRRGVVYALWLSLLPFASSLARDTGSPPQPPQVLFQDLFSAVQNSHIYPDGKAFPDAVPNAAPKDILAQYHAEKPGFRPRSSNSSSRILRCRPKSLGHPRRRTA